MKNTLLKATAVASIISAPLLIIGCGGGSTSTTATQMSKITGTVPGTLIEAFCANGTHVTVTSVQNGTAQHPFEISVPQNTECRLVMTTNENDPVNRVVSNIGFATATATGLTLSLNQDLNLGHIPLPMDPNAVPTVNNMVVDPIIVNVDPVMDPNAPAVMDPNAPAVMDPNAPAVMDPAAMTPATPVLAAVNNTPIAAFDTNGNGIIDAYEDMNNNGIMDAFDPDYVAPAAMAPTTPAVMDPNAPMDPNATATPTTTGDYDDNKGSSDDYYDDSKGSSDSSYDTSSSSSDSSYDTSSSSSDSSYDDDKGSSDDYDDDKGSSDDYDDKGSND